MNVGVLRTLLGPMQDMYRAGQGRAGQGSHAPNAAHLTQGHLLDQ